MTDTVEIRASSPVGEMGTALIAIFLEGGPTELPLQSRSFLVAPGEVVRIRFRDHYCYYRRTDRLVYFVGDRCVVFQWIKTEKAV
jgi:hypothetical protein